MKAVWNGATLAESNETIIVEGNHYFPPSSVNNGFFTASHTQMDCPWKGVAHYFHIKVEDKLNEDAAWSYPDPKPAAKKIKHYIAFWHGVVITR
ncbi:DUF427 domain-containing protein [Zooshikella sp. RANM57]|uniref:DUF427 domain-containing protein n=1 Tax=Zooshikella sp. RANM57 TaxID=3425863 RepID=UPI003D6FC44F